VAHFTPLRKTPYSKNCATPRWNRDGNSFVGWQRRFARLGNCEPASVVHAPTGSLAVSLVIPAGGVSEVTFLLTWHFPIGYPGGLRSATRKRGTENWRGSEIITQKNSAMHGMWPGASLLGPESQLGPGCLVDQLFGQYFAHIIGLGYLAKPENVAKALASILKFNFKRGFKDHFNHMRSYVLNGESALLMATYPHGNRPQRPFPYFDEVMTGFEYTAAVGMIYGNAVEEGLLCIEAIRERLGHISSTAQRELQFVLPHGS
jgi:Glycosyl-hydrolase family 116, catalytic region